MEVTRTPKEKGRTKIPARRFVLSNREVDRFREFIAERTGLYFKDHDRRVLREGIRERVISCGFESGGDYYTFLLSAPEGKEEMKKLLDRLIVGHTYFFRNRSHFRALREEVLPEIIDRKARANPGDPSRPELRIWSAGCSTGEEPYSIAMAVRDVAPNPDALEVRVYATDISNRALAMGRIGGYGKNAMRRVDAWHLERYFTADPAEPNGYCVKDEIRQMVEFSYLNIWKDPFPVGFDVVFCRNVFIYFRRETIVEVVDKFYESLHEGGSLFVGDAEGLHYLTNRFEARSSPDVIYYRKKGEGKEKKSPPPRKIAPASRRRRRPHVGRVAKERRPRRASKREHPLRERRSFEELIDRALCLMDRKEYEKAHILARQAMEIRPAAAEPYCLIAEIDANQGRRDEARSMLKQALEIHPFSACAHYLSASVRFEEGRLEEAEKWLRKTIYLDSGFPMAHFLSGVLYERLGRVEKARREFRNTIEALNGTPSQERVPCGGGFHGKALIAVCRANIERLRAKR